MNWVRLRRWEDRGQYHNLIAELYQEDQPAFGIFNLDVSRDLH